MYSSDSAAARSATELRKERAVYAASVFGVALGSLLILHFFATTLTRVVDVAATILFVFAPFVAVLNHRTMTGSDLADDARPGRLLNALSIAGIAWLTTFLAFYLYVRFFA